MFEITRSSFTLFDLTIRWYGVLIAASVLAALCLCAKREERLGFEKDFSLNLTLVCIPFGLLFARAYYVIFNWGLYAAHPMDIFNIRQGGMAFYGGLIGGVIGAWFYTRIKKLSLLRVADLVAPGLALGQAIGRWGNFLNQEAYGVEITNPAWQFFPAAVKIGEKWHCATFFYESAWCALIVLALLTAERKGAFRRTGDGFRWYLILYAAERLIVEGLRTDSLYLGNIRISQLLSLAALLVLMALPLFQGDAHSGRRWIPLLGMLLTAASLWLMPLGFTALLMALTLASAIIIEWITEKRQ